MAKPNPLSKAAEQVAASLNAPDDLTVTLPAEPSVTLVQVKTTRQGKRFLGYYVEPVRHEEIKQAALDEGIQIQELLRRAVDAWMIANGAEAVAAVERRQVRRAERTG